MANVKLATAAKNAALDAIRTLIDADAGAGSVKIYSGTQPTDANTAIGAQVLLATLPFTDPAAAAASSGTLTFSSITADASADATGTAAWARIVDNSGDTVFDCDVGTSGATINLNTTSIVAGANVSITSFTLTHP